MVKAQHSQNHHQHILFTRYQLYICLNNNLVYIIKSISPTVLAMDFIVQISYKISKFPWLYFLHKDIICLFKFVTSKMSYEQFLKIDDISENTSLYLIFFKAWK